METIVTSMKVQGYDETQPVVLYEGKVLDGWGRYEAAAKAGVQAVYHEFTGNRQQAVEFAYFRLLARRHLSDGRLSAVAILYNKQRVINGQEELTHEALAEIAQVSKSYVSQASSVYNRDPEKISAIVKGEQSLPRAYRELQQSLPERIDGNDPLADVWATREKWKLVIVRLQELGEKDIDPLFARRGSEVIVESMASKVKENGTVKLGKTFVQYTIEQIKSNMPDRPCANCDGRGCEVCQHKGWWTVAQTRARSE